MLTPITPEEYAQILVERFNSWRSFAGDQRLKNIFLGAKLSLSDIERWSPETAVEMREAYAIAEKELFPL